MILTVFLEKITYMLVRYGNKKLNRKYRGSRGPINPEKTFIVSLADQNIGSVRKWDWRVKIKFKDYLSPTERNKITHF